MPRVPVLSGPQVDSRPLPTPYESPAVSPDAFGANVGRSIAQAGEVGGEYVLRAKAQADLALTQKQEAALRGYANEALWGKNGLKAQEGENALKASAGIYEGFEKKRVELEGALVDPKQRAAFGVAAQNVLDSFRSEAENHVAHQRKVMAAQGLQGTLATTKAAIANGFESPTVVDDGMRAIEANLRAYGAAHGVPEAETTALIGQHQAEAARTVIYGYMAPGRVDGAGAQAAYAQLKDKLAYLPENERHVLVSQIGHTAAAQEADGKAISIVRDSMGLDGQVDRRKAQGLVDALPAGQMKDETQRRVDHKAAIFDAAWKDEATNLAAKVIAQGVDEATGEFSLANVNPADLHALEVKWPTKAAEIRKQTAAADAKGRYAQAVEHFFGPEGWEATARMKPEEFLTDSMTIGLPAKHRTALIERYQAQQKRISVPPPESLVLEEARRALSMGKTAKIGSLPAEKQQAFADLFNAVAGDVKQWSIDNKGAHPDREKVRGFIREELQVVSSGFFAPTVRRFQSAQPAPMTAPTKRKVYDPATRTIKDAP